MSRHEIITVGRGAKSRTVRVERPRRRKVASAYTRELVHQIGLAAVADELGVAAMLPMGGVMTAERGRAIDARKGASKPVTKIDMGPPPIVIPAPGLLAADISRNIFPDRQRQFGADLIGGVL